MEIAVHVEWSIQDPVFVFSIYAVLCTSIIIIFYTGGIILVHLLKSEVLFFIMNT